MRTLQKSTVDFNGLKIFVLKYAFRATLIYVYEYYSIKIKICKHFLKNIDQYCLKYTQYKLFYFLTKSHNSGKSPLILRGAKKIFTLNIGTFLFYYLKNVGKYITI